MKHRTLYNPYVLGDKTITYHSKMRVLKNSTALFAGPPCSMQSGNVSKVNEIHIAFERANEPPHVRVNIRSVIQLVYKET